MGMGSILFPMVINMLGYRHGVREGWGEFRWVDGSRYEGGIKGMEERVGVMVAGNGKKYSGMCTEDKLHGEGQISWVNGELYSGEIKCGLKHGFAKMISANGEICFGGFCDNYKEGRGEMKFSNGDRYIGDFSKIACMAWENIIGKKGKIMLKLSRKTL